MVTHYPQNDCRGEYWICCATHTMELGAGWESAPLGSLLTLADSERCTKLITNREGGVATVYTLTDGLWAAERRELISVSCPVDPVRQQRTKEQAECDQFAKETSRGNWDKVAQP